MLAKDNKVRLLGVGSEGGGRTHISNDKDARMKS